MSERVWMSVNLSKIQENLQTIQKITNSKIMAVIKDNAYGLGMAIACYLEKFGIDHFAVATVDEAIALRKLGVTSDILIFGRTAEKQLHLLSEYQLTQTILSLDYAKTLNQYGSKVRGHLKIDTGMHRNGLECIHDYHEIDAVLTLENIEITGIYTHLSAADINLPAAIKKTNQQLQTFTKLLDYLNDKQVNYGITHVLNSGGILNYSQWHFDYVRPGLLLTGMTDDSRIAQVFSIKSCITDIKHRHQNEQIGYGLDSVLTDDSLIAVVSCGYGDGIDRRMKGKYVYIHNKPCKIIANICMDQMLVDVTGVDCQVNDEVTIFGQDLSLLELADDFQTIVNELLVRFTSRVVRVYQMM